MKADQRKKIGEGQRRAWDDGRRRRVPIGSTRIKNGRVQIKVLSAKGWEFWKYERVGRNYDILSAEEILELPFWTKSWLRKRGFDVPKRKGGVPKGYKQTPEHIDKRRNARRKYLFDMQALSREAKERVRHSYEYQQWRLAVFVRDNWTCQKCGKRNGGGEEIYLEAHHIKSYTRHPKLRFEVSNGVTLCLACHKKENKKQMIGNTNGKTRWFKPKINLS